MEKQIPASILAVDLGGTNLLLGEVTPSGEILHTKSYPSHTSTQAAAMEGIIQAIHDYRTTEPIIAREQIAVGIGVVGRVDQRQGLWLEIEPGKSELTDVKRIIEKLFKLPCGVDNDVACATKAEQRFGWGTLSEDFIYYNIGTGIAAGVVARGKYIEGGHFNAGEIGHMVVALDSQIECGCGRTGCVERIASGLGMHERAVALQAQYETSSLLIENGKRVPAQAIFEAAQNGDPLGLRVVEDAARAAAASIMNLVRTTDPDTIVLGGGVAQNEYFISKIKNYLNARTMRFVTNGLVATMQTTQDAALVGAALAGYEAINSYRGGDIRR